MATAAALLAGCVSQTEFDRENQVARAAENRVFELQRQIDDAEARVQAHEQRDAQRDEVVTNQRRQIQTLTRDLTSARRTMEMLDERFADLGQAVLDPELQSALADLATREASVMSYDAAHGVIRLGSDASFASGSTELKPDATTVVERLATVLKGHQDLPFEVWVVGHTDSQPVANPAVKRLYPTNTHLSVARAISVQSVLVRAGLPAARVGVGGWGEYRPVVAATPRGEAENRRVEIYLRPSTLGVMPAAANPTTPATGTADAADDDAPMK